MFLEFLPVLVALRQWWEALQNRRVTFVSDNEALVHVVNQMATKDVWVLHILRELVLQCLEYNNLNRAKHIAENGWPI